MKVCVLGPLVVLDGDDELRIGGRQHQRILARLALARGTTVPAAELEVALWDDSPPATARHTIATRVFQLRSRGLAIDTAGDGYALRDATDAAEFEQLAVGRPTGQSPTAGPGTRERLATAIGLWRGRPYPELDDLAEVVSESARLVDLLAEAQDRLLEADVEGGDLPSAIAQARRLTADQPYRERRWELLMLGLYRSGRQADALAAYAECRRVLVDDLGIEPGPALRRMQQAVLSQDPALDRPAASSAGATGPAGVTGAAPHPTRLPGTSTRLVGRGSERHELARVWERARLATVFGPPGAGKTRLALEAARTDPGPVWYVALEQAADQPVAAAILGVVASASRAPDASAGLREALAESDGLLLLDGCEVRRAEVTNELTSLLVDCPRLRILATSRERLGHPDEALIPIGGLSAEDALDLLVDRARLSDPAFHLSAVEADDAERLCSLVDRLPLAIELVARHLQLLSVAEVTERVAADVGRWAGQAADGRSGMWAALAGSFARLSPVEVAVQVGLSVMAAEADVDLIAAVAGPDVDGTLVDADVAFDVVARLVDASLVQVRSASGRTRYDVLQTVGRYGRETADPANLAAMERRYVATVLHRTGDLAASLNGPERGETLAAIDGEMPHVRAVLSSLWSDGSDRASALTGLELAVALTDYWLSRRPAEGLEFLARLVDASDPPPAIRAAARLGQAHLSYWLGEFESGTRVGEEARTLFAAIGDRRGEGRALRRIGAIAAASDDMASARSALEASLSALDDAGHEEEVGTTLLHLGSLLADEGDVAAALPLLERARSAAERRDDPLAVGHVLAALNLAHWKANDLSTAVTVGDAALNVFRELGHRPTEATVAYRLSAVSRGLGRPAAARRYALLAIEAGEQVQTRTSVALGHVGLARLDLDAGSVDGAADHLRAALELHDPRADRWVLVEVLEAVARLVVPLDRRGAAELLRSSAAIRAEIRQPIAPTETPDLAATRSLAGIVAPNADADDAANLPHTDPPTADGAAGGAPLAPTAAHALAVELLRSVPTASAARPPGLTVLPRSN
jgi:DNA-binding SARP family transcriptional activator/predicted ATPase